jgi:16S rRNA processing protein RimM
MVVEPLTDDPRRYGQLSTLRVSGADPAFEARLEHWRLMRDGRVIVWLDAARDRTRAEELVGALLEVSVDQAVKPPDGSYYRHDLIGLQVVDSQRRPIGTIRELMETPAGDILVTEKTGGGEVLIPAVRAMISSVDLDSGQVVVELPDGLMELNDSQ